MQVLEDGRISVPFQRTNGVLSFADSLVMTPEEYEVLTENDITAMQDARFAAWLAHIEEASNLPIEEAPLEVVNGE